MIGLIVAIVVFNTLAFITNQRLNKNKIVHIWIFTVALQLLFDLFVDQKYQGYWYFTQDVDWEALPALTLLVPPVNIMFLNWYPFKASLVKQSIYVFWWWVIILAYEAISLLPEPWGYFHYGWWKFSYSALINPLLLWIILKYYIWVCQLEKEAALQK